MSKFYFSFNMYLSREDNKIVEIIIKKNQIEGISVSKTIVEIIKDYDKRGLNLKNKEIK